MTTVLAESATQPASGSRPGGGVGPDQDVGPMPIDDRHTRLISRSRVPRGRAALAYALLLEIPHFVMQRKMLLGIKARAERAAGGGTPLDGGKRGSP